MRDLLIVGGGSFLGGACRYYLSGWVMHSFIDMRFPLGTLAVNFLGCFAIGIIGGLAEHHHMFSPPIRLFLITGLLGGFTTFSAFGYETLYLVRTGGLNLAFLNVILSVVLCLLAVWFGLRLVQLF